MDNTPAVFQWSFRYRAYKKTRTIQLKPAHDNQKHFSIVWQKEKNDITLEEFNLMDKEIRELLKTKNSQLIFKIVKPTTNCTYGHFDEDFENLIKSYRLKYKLCKDKDMDLEREDLQYLKQLEVWDELNPIFFHIYSRDPNDKDWCEMLRESPRGTLIICKIEMLKTE